MSKFFSILAIATFGLGVTMVATNPNREAYGHHMIHRITDDAQNEICRTGDRALNQANPLGDLCNHTLLGLSTWQYERLQQVVQTTTDERQYFVFTLYEMQLPGRQYTTLGVMGQFISLNG